MLVSDEVAEEYELTGYEVLTPGGWRSVTKVYKTIPMPVWRLRTQSYSLLCSGGHIVKGTHGWLAVRDAGPGTEVITESGVEEVIECAPTGETKALFDITVDDPSGEFFSDGILSHNSTTFCVRQIVMSQLFPGYRGLYVAPSHPMLETYASRLLEMESYFRGSLGKQNKYSKRYTNRSMIDLSYCLETARDCRGKSVDECLIDECQSLNADLLPEILYTQTTSKIPMTIYAGTALSTETLLELRWRESSMGMWHIRAMDGKHWLNMYDRETLYKVCNSPIGPVCPYTGKKLDVTNGCYVHANKQALEDGNMGIHVPQCIIKDIADDPLQWAKVYRHIQEDDFKKVLQECFGIAVAEGSREITVTDLQAICTLQLDPADIIERCKRGYYKMIISGCDWGGSDYVPAQKSKKSYTVHCIIGLAPDGIVDILHYRQYSGMGYPEIAAQIIADHRAHFGKALASDFGVGMAYNNELRKYMPIDRHFVMGYTAPDTKALAVPKGDHYPNQLSLNRTESLTNTFRDLKQRKIRARLWEHSGKYLLDWLNMCRIPTETANGRKTFLYRRPPEKSDDALHAFNFAYALMKFYKGESLVEDPAVTKAINAALYAATPMQQAMAQRIQQKIAGNTQWVISG